MSPNGKSRLVFALFVLAMLFLIGRNGYRRYQRVALFRAAEQGDTAHLKSLLKHGVDVNLVNRYEDSSGQGKVQESPLMLAARAKKWETVSLLLKAGADARFHDGGQSPLGYAIQDGNVRMVQELLQRHADPNATDMTSSPVLFSALDTKNGRLIRALLEAGADPNAINNEGVTALNVAVGIVDVTSSTNYMLSRIRRGSGSQAETERGSSNVSNSISRLDLARLLRAHGADVNAQRFPSRYTPLMSAVITGNKEVVQFLLAQGASTTVKVRMPSPASPPVATPLSLAKQYKHPDIVALLLKAGAKE